MTRQIFCDKHQVETDGLLRQPYPGELGKRIFDHIGQAAWDEWLAHQTMLINEYRLNMLDRDARDFLKTEMVKFLFEGGSDKPGGFVAPENSNAKEDDK
jgi:Fe-S cluster biosynthesis and repair protein YggX